MLGSSPSTVFHYTAPSLIFSVSVFMLELHLHYISVFPVRYLNIFLFVCFLCVTLMNMKKHVISLLFVYQFFVHNNYNTLLSWVARVVKYWIKSKWMLHTGGGWGETPHMIVKRFGCTTIHNKALYKCFIHSFIQNITVLLEVLGSK